MTRSGNKGDVGSLLAGSIVLVVARALGIGSMRWLATKREVSSFRTRREIRRETWQNLEVRFCLFARSPAYWRGKLLNVDFDDDH